MFKVAVCGAGRIGEAICGLLSPSGRYKIIVADEDVERANSVANAWDKTTPAFLDLVNKKNLSKLLRGVDAVISALPFHANVPLAKIASDVGTNYFDLTEDVEVTKAVSSLALKSKGCFMPQCGLAPGFISIAGAHMVTLFDEIDSLKLRVGALPLYPSNRLKYNLTWSTEGLINEYGNPCEMIRDGKRVQALPLQGLEQFSIDGNEYEAFNTSGGLGSLCDTLEGKVRKLDYKTVRYPGHRDLVAFLMQDLRFNEDRAYLKKVFERSISFTPQDKVIILVEARGNFQKKLIQKTYASTVYHTNINGHHFSAIQLTTAAGICTLVDLLLTGKFKKTKGLIRNEDIPLPLFLQNEFGKHFLDKGALDGISS